MKHIYDNGQGKSAEERFTERFREVAQNYEPTFEPADWSAMQSKLAAHNEKDRRKVVFRRLAMWASMGAAAVVLLFGGYQFLDNSAKEVSNKNLAIYNQSNKNNSLSQPINASSIEETNTNIQEEIISNQNLAKNSLEQNQKSEKFTRTKSLFEVEKISKNTGVSNSTINQVTTVSNNFNSDNNDIVEPNNTLLEDIHSERKLSVLALDKNNSALFFNPEAEEITLPEIEIDETALASVIQNEEVVRKNPVASAVGKWRFGAALAAMTNLYRSNDKQRINYANGYGMMIDRQIAKRFNISTGAMYTQKRIDIEEPLDISDIATSFDPNINDAAWVKKNKTQINWQLLDLPVNIRYDAIQTKRNKWFASVGTSNYFFLKENYESDYTVSFPDTYDPRLTRTQEVVRQRETQSAIQLFATINVSAGVETSLGKHLTLQVEPYWKFPVRSLGSEGVFVQTGGLLTRINFAL
ncbi:outer membrane beta-barrel protein [Bernardetia sp.]|uniref:outer membrane beta-barrel protein n=1 Tax=Bernardetia sp. TaxID=1937974 RepID=UPI0025C60A67|nr:outer membrane beta-barrel protein [Bernardetia sp.]